MGACMYVGWCGCVVIADTFPPCRSYDGGALLRGHTWVYVCVLAVRMLGGLSSVVFLPSASAWARAGVCMRARMYVGGSVIRRCVCA